MENEPIHHPIGVQGIKPGATMVRILDGNSEQVAHVWRKIGLFLNHMSACSRSKKMP